MGNRVLVLGMICTELVVRFSRLWIFITCEWLDPLAIEYHSYKQKNKTNYDKHEIYCLQNGQVEFDSLSIIWQSMHVT
jgi:hypothetical protein